MKKNLQKKLSACLPVGMAFIVAAMLFSASANAQIVYKDVIPNATISSNGGVYHLDLNNDGINDFNITYTTTFIQQFCNGSLVTGTNIYIMITPLSSNEVGNGTIYPSALLLNSQIDSSSFTWKNNANQILTKKEWSCNSTRFGILWGFGYGGNWNGLVDKYIPLRLGVSSQKYYGWVRLDVTSGAVNFIVKDYAYNSIPNQPIRAGETSCTIPTVGLTQSSSLSFCNGDSVTFTANGTGYQYQWKKNNVNIIGATTQTYVAKTAGIYNCKVTNSCGSKTTGIRTVTIPCRMSNDNIVETLEHLSVYPNPATNALTIKFPSDSHRDDEAAVIQVVNLFGQIVYSERINPTALGKEQTQIDVSKFSAGMYVIRWSSGENFETKTFSVTK